MRIGIAVGEMSGPAASIDELVEQIRRAEDDGFATAHVANVFGFDALTKHESLARTRAFLARYAAAQP